MLPMKMHLLRSGSPSPRWCAAAIAQSPGDVDPRWESRRAASRRRLRGVSAVSERVAWASGAGGTVLRTADGGATWQKLTVPDAEKLDFRDVDAVSETTAYILSIGPGPASRIYKTTDAGAPLELQFANENPKAFFDAMAFWDAARTRHGRLGRRRVRHPGDA